MSNNSWIERRINSGISLSELRNSCIRLLKNSSGMSNRNIINQKIKDIDTYISSENSTTYINKEYTIITIYVLCLQNNKYYIGKSNNPMLRYQEHLNGNGSAWTKKYKPISIEKIIETNSHFDEDRYTKEYMAKYGIDNVRGGSYVEIELDDYQKELLQREIWGAQNKCSRCGKLGHFIKDCFVNINI